MPSPTETKKLKRESEWERVEILAKDVGYKLLTLKYKDLDDEPPNYGRQMFKVELIWKRGKVVEALVYPSGRLAVESQTYYHIKGLKCGHVDLHSGLRSHNIWHMHYCEEHKAQVFEVYVPTGTNTLEITSGLGDYLSFSFQ